MSAEKLRVLACTALVPMNYFRSPVGFFFSAASSSSLFFCSSASSLHATDLAVLGLLALLVADRLRTMLPAEAAPAPEIVRWKASSGEKLYVGLKTYGLTRSSSQTSDDCSLSPVASTRAATTWAGMIPAERRRLWR